MCGGRDRARGLSGACTLGQSVLHTRPSRAHQFMHALRAGQLSVGRAPWRAGHRHGSIAAARSGAGTPSAGRLTHTHMHTRGCMVHLTGGSAMRITNMQYVRVLYHAFHTYHLVARGCMTFRECARACMHVNLSISAQPSGDRAAQRCLNRTRPSAWDAVMRYTMRMQAVGMCTLMHMRGPYMRFYSNSVAAGPGLQVVCSCI